MAFRWGVCFCLVPALLPAQWFAGAGGGVSTLSADGGALIDSSRTEISSYKPENGATLHAFAGRHLTNYLSFQGAYTWNRNAVSLTRAGIVSGTETTYQQDYSTRTHAASAEALVYFRPTRSRIRPYLSGGAGALQMRATAVRLTLAKGPVVLPPASFSATHRFFRTTVGVDIHLLRGYAFRYNFWETLSRNPVSRQLSPAGARNLANFQSVFSLLKVF